MNWYQLTYASVEKTADRPGGWGTIESSPALPDAAEQRLLAGVVNRIDEVVPTDEFALRKELDARVRSFSYRPEAGGGTWWHAVVAGKDATGRPGNIFTHAVSVEDFPPELRPVDLWRSKDWLTPFGATEVAGSALGSVVVPGVQRHDGIEFALAQRDGVVESLLSAVVWCFENDRSLVLAVRSGDEFVDWLRAISYLTSASVARQIPFSTFVRAESLPARSRQFEILGTPSEDLPALKRMLASTQSPLLLLDLANLPTARVGDSWEHLGQTWSGGERWLDAYYVLSNDAGAQINETVSMMDELTSSAVLQDHLSPEWPLALALLRRDGEAHADAELIISEWNRLQPFDGLDDPTLLALLAPPVDPPEPDFHGLLEVEPEVEEPVGVNWGDYPDAWKLSADTEIDVITSMQSDPSSDRPAIQAQHRIGPLLRVLIDSGDEELEFLRDALLLSLGIGRPADAGMTHQVRVDELLAGRNRLSVELVDLLENWKLRYHDVIGNPPGHGGA